MYSILCIYVPNEKACLHASLHVQYDKNSNGTVSPGSTRHTSGTYNERLPSAMFDSQYCTPPTGAY